MAQERASLGEVGQRSEEREPAGVVQRDQPGEEQVAEQLAEHAHRQEKPRPRGYPAHMIECDPTPGHHHCTWEWRVDPILHYAPARAERS